MKILIKAAAVAFVLELILGAIAMLTFTPCASGAPGGLLGVLGFVAWTFHIPGNFLAQELANAGVEFWIIMFSVGFLQALVVVWIAITIYTRKHAS